MENFAKITEALATLFWGVGFLVFFGPIITILSIVGKFKLGLINLDWSKQSKFTRALLGFIGLGMWIAIYIPLVSLAFRLVPQTPSPLITETPTSTLTQPTETVSPAIINTATLSSIIGDPSSIVITEVLGNPCGGDSRNEFIELYNSGENPIDVSEWWITDGQEADMIVSWQSRYPNIAIGFLTKTDTAIIQSHSYAVILPPGYPFVVQSGFVMPYIFPENTLILTINKGQLLGDENNGIAVSNRDVVVLYQGNEFAVDRVISSYGSPILSSSPTAIRDDGKDEIPIIRSINECWSVERILAVNEDVESNWREISKSTPGSGNYP